MAKIVIVGSAHPLRGGIATFVERLAAFLQEQGHEVIIYSYSLQYPNFLFPGKSQYADTKAPENLKIQTVINSVNPLNWIQVGRMLKKEVPDLVISKFWLPFFGPCLGTIFRIARRNRHSKMIAILDNVIPHEKRPGDKAFARYFLKANHGFVTMSKEVLSDLNSFALPQPSIFTYHPLYDVYGDAVEKKEARTVLGLPQGYHYLLFFGFIRKYKGLELLLEAMADPRIREANVRLIVAGEFYEDASPYQAKIEQLGIADLLELRTDFIPNDQVRYYFSAADVVVQPYLSATQSGISQIAYFFEKPMIVTDVGGLPEIVPNEKVGYVCPVNAEAITNQILEIINPEVQEKMIAGIKEEKKKFEWSYFVNAIFELFKKTKE